MGAVGRISRHTGSCMVRRFYCIPRQLICVASVTSIHYRFDITVDGGSAGAGSSGAYLAAATAQNDDCSSSSIGDDAEIDFAPLNAYAGSEGRGVWQQQ